MKTVHSILVGLSTLGIYFGLPTSTEVTVVSEQAHVSIRTKKVAEISGPIDGWSEYDYESQIRSTQELPGDRVIMINSPGGSVEDGEKMIRLMREEQSHGIKQICVVTQMAHSMAFNLLTQCDVRIMVKSGSSVVHKVRVQLFGVYTAARMRDMAIEMDLIDEPYRLSNARAMHLNLDDYDKFADEETEWSAADLMAIGYLNGFLDN